MVVTLGLWVIFSPLPKNVPPQLPEYQYHCAPEPSAPPLRLKFTDAPWQMVFAGALVVIEVGAVDTAFTTTVLLVVQLPMEWVIV